MRNLDSNAIAKVSQRFGAEAINIIEIQWVEDGGVLSYADRDVEYIPGKIKALSNLDAIVNVSDNTDSQEVVITLDDTDGSIRAIMDRNDIHKRNVWIYQYFEGLALADKFLLFNGKINSPITWVEADRTLTFTVLAQLEDVEIGFAPAEGEFPEMPQSLIDEPWPMVFGTVTHSRTLKLTPDLKGITADGVGFPDFTLGPRLGALQDIWVYQRRALLQPQQHSSHYHQFVQVARTSRQQRETAVDAIRVFNGEKFPRGNIQIKVGNSLLDGRFGGSTRDVFFIDGGSGNPLQHPSRREYCWGGPQETTGYGRSFGTCAIGDKVKTLPYAVGYWIGTQGTIGGRWFIPTGQVAGDSAGYVYEKPGATVELVALQPQSYVVSITPGQVLRVVAWATKNGQRFIQDIPTNWYSVDVVDFGNISATIVTIDDSLGKKGEFGFEDDIYVTFKSTIGPNTVEILEYLIDLYTDFNTDTTSFDHVRDKLENYPSHFAYYDRPNILDALQQIAWQANCAIYLKNGTFYLLYLPETPNPTVTVAADDVLKESLVLAHTTTEDLVTKMVCKWTASGIQEGPFRTTLRANVKKYGTQEEEYDYYIYDFIDPVLKSATFWLIRYSNTWKKVRFTTPLTKLALETFDFIIFDVDGIVANGPVPAMIEAAGFDSETQQLLFECWTPVKAGTMEQYEFAFTSDTFAYQTFPTESEIQQGYNGGVGPGKGSKAPSGFNYIKTQWAIVGSNSPDKDENEYEEEDPYDQSDDEEDRRKEDQGNPKPSTEGDVHPGEKKIPGGKTMEEPNPGPDSPNADGAAGPQPDGYAGPNSGYPEAPPAGPDSSSAEAASGGTGSPTQDNLDSLPRCDDSELVNCPKVDVTWLNGVDKVSQPQGGGPCVQTREPPERGVCTSTGGFQHEIIVFTTNAEAMEFAAAMQAQITKKGLTGDTIPYFANYIAGTDDCNDTGGEGPKAYCNNNATGYGSGAFLDGVPSNGYGE